MASGSGASSSAQAENQQTNLPPNTPISTAIPPVESTRNTPIAHPHVLRQPNFLQNPQYNNGAGTGINPGAQQFYPNTPHPNVAFQPNVFQQNAFPPGVHPSGFHPSSFNQPGFHPFPQIPYSNSSHQQPTNLGSSSLTVKLTDSNYLLWKNQLLNVIISNGLEAFIDGTFPPPPKFLDPNHTQVNLEHYFWEKANRLVMGWLYSSLSEDKMSEIVSCSTAFEIWETLRRVYESVSTASIMSLRSQLQKAKKNGSTVSQFLAHIKQIADKLSAIGEPLSYRNHVAYILDGLGAEYNPFVTSIQNRTDRPSLEDIRSLLLSYEVRLDRQNSIEQLNLVQANLANLSFTNSRRPQWPYSSNSTPSSSPNSSNPNPHPNPPPQYHTSPASPAPYIPPPDLQNRQSGPPNQNHRWGRQRPQFQICTKVGHTALVCFNRDNKERYPPIMPPRPQAHFAAQYPSVPHPIMPSEPSQPQHSPIFHQTPPQFQSQNSSIPQTSHPDQEWFFDSGATHHMTPNINSISNPTPYTGHTVQSQSLKYPKFISLEGSDIHLRSKPDGIRFRFVSYNILAQVYVKSSLFPHSPSPCLKWKARSQAILAILENLQADFLCLQELDEYDSFYKGNLERCGYSSLYIQRSGQKRDGCGILYKHENAELIIEDRIEYNDLVDSVRDGDGSCEDKSVNAVSTGSNDAESNNGQQLKNSVVDHGDRSDPRVRLKRDCVGIMAAFKFKKPFHHVVIIANTHLYWDPKLADVKLAQAKYLLSRLAQFKRLVSEKFECTPSVLVAGDFNSTPGDKVYQYLLSGNSSSGSLPENFEELPLPLCSVYAITGSEPSFTNCTPGFTGTLDYIFFSPSDSIRPVSLLELPESDWSEVIGGLPNFSHPSDHLPVGAEFELNME